MLKDINHGNGLRGSAVLLVCGIMHPMILEKGKKNEALHTGIVLVGRHNNFIMVSASESSTFILKITRIAVKRGRIRHCEVGFFLSMEYL